MHNLTAPSGAAQAWTMLEHPPSGTERSYYPPRTTRRRPTTPYAAIDAIIATFPKEAFIRQTHTPPTSTKPKETENITASEENEDCDKWTDFGDEDQTTETLNQRQAMKTNKPPSKMNSFDKALLKTASHAFDDLKLDLLLESVTQAQISSSEAKQNHSHIPITPEWARSLLEWPLQKKLQDEIGQQISEKLDIIRTVIILKEKQCKLNDREIASWIFVNWNLNKVVLQTLRNIKDCLRGEKCLSRNLFNYTMR